MRPILPSDLDLAARVLLAVPPAGRVAAMDEMVVAAQRADQQRMATGRLGPEEGDGSLLSAALARPHGPAQAAGGEYRRCLAIVLERLAAAERSIAGCDARHHAYMAGATAQIAVT